MPASRYRYGAEKAGFILRTRVDGSNGIAGITWGGECPTRTRAKSSAGRLFGDTSPKSNATVSRTICCADGVSAKPFCIGLTTAAKSELSLAIVRRPIPRAVWSKRELGVEAVQFALVEAKPCGLPTTVTNKPLSSSRLATRRASSRVTASIMALRRLK